MVTKIFDDTSNYKTVLYFKAMVLDETLGTNNESILCIIEYSEQEKTTQKNGFLIFFFVSSTFEISSSLSLATCKFIKLQPSDIRPENLYSLNQFSSIRNVNNFLLIVRVTIASVNVSVDVNL